MAAWSLRIRSRCRALCPPSSAAMSQAMGISSRACAFIWVSSSRLGIVPSQRYNLKLTSSQAPSGVHSEASREMDLTIGEAARRAGVAPSTLRYYERLGLLPAPKRVSGWRRYPPDVARALRLIRVAKEAGFTLTEIQTLVRGFPEDGALSERWKTLARRKLPEVEALIRRAE